MHSKTRETRSAQKRKLKKRTKNTVPHCQLSHSRDAMKLVYCQCRYHRHCLHLPVLFLDQKSQFVLCQQGTYLVQTLHTGVQGNARPGTIVFERDVHSSFDCSQLFCSPFRCSWRFGRTQNKATTRQPGILFGWSCRLEQSATGHLFRTDITNFQKHAQDTSFLTFLLY